MSSSCKVPFSFPFLYVNILHFLCCTKASIEKVCAAWPHISRGLAILRVVKLQVASWQLRGASNGKLTSCKLAGFSVNLKEKKAKQNKTKKR